MRSKNPKPSSKFTVSTSSKESSLSDWTMDDSEVIGTVTADNPAISSGRDVGLHAGNETGQFFKYPENVGVAKKFLQYKKTFDRKWGHYVINTGLWFRTLNWLRGRRGRIPLLFKPDRIWVKYFPNLFPKGEPNPKVVADTSSLFDVVNREGNKLNKVLGELNICREKRLESAVEKVQRAHQNRVMDTSGLAYTDVMEIPAYAIPPVGTEGVDADVNMAPSLKKQKKESGKDIRASSKGVNLKAVEQEALDLAKRDPIRLDTQIRSSISQLSVGWKSAAEVLKLAAADRDELVWQHDAEKAALEDVNLALAGKYNEIIFPGNDASPIAEQSPTPPVADDKTEEEVVRLRRKVIEMEKALSRARDSINRTQQVHNKLEYERRLHKSNFDNTFKKLFELQCRYGKIIIERDEVLQKESDMFALFQKSLKDKRFVDESDKLECQRSLLSLTLYFKAEVDSERGLKEAYLELLTERSKVPDLARVKILAQEARNCHSIEVQRCSAQAGVSIIWGGVGPLPDELDFYTQKRLQVSQSCLKKKITPKRGKRAINMDHERQITDVIVFYGGELERVENEFRRYISSCGKDVEVENDKVENMWFARGNEGGGASTSKMRPEESEEEESRQNAVTVKLSCKDAEILTANNEAELWKKSLKKKKLETMSANQQKQDAEIRHMRERLKKLNWDLREARDSCQRKSDHAKTHEEACSKKDQNLNETINKCNTRIANLDREKQALILECMQGNDIFEELHMKYKDSQRMVDVAEAKINYSREVDKKLQRLKQEMERSVQITKQYRGSLLQERKSLADRCKDLEDELNKVKAEFCEATLLTADNVTLRDMAMLHADVEKF
ncbi:hypothetical protein GIB67_008670 [Kingdonia uniflora]|uniref:Uncharacterized protein n=1 Tax=Kingdonia uniflora TaxID=39325 RepID=A0A7J7M4Y1_9MAGN|nr:hypothetical protein GIB67_008670 [Kingdonia uniflora]